NCIHVCSLPKKMCGTSPDHLRCCYKSVRKDRRSRDSWLITCAHRQKDTLDWPWLCVRLQQALVLLLSDHPFPLADLLHNFLGEELEERALLSHVATNHVGATIHSDIPNLRYSSMRRMISVGVPLMPMRPPKCTSSPTFATSEASVPLIICIAARDVC